jgi:transcriptional regulator with XRE-family HTH domain
MSLSEDWNKLDLSAIYRDIDIAEAEIQAKLDSLRTNEPLFQHFAAYNFFNEGMGLSGLLTVPSEILVLVVTMAMGILGSVVTMTWLFIHDDNTLTLRRFIVLPFIGAISAFIIFIFVSAGQLTLTAGDANDSLNPYVLSFIGVISGLLSERAYNRISAVGTNFFNVDDGQPRWGSRIREAMDAAGVTDAELARYLSVSEEEATRIVGESTTATLEQQRLTAACLRRTVRELFTDVPPDGPSTIAAAPGVDVPDLAGLDAPGLERALADAGLRIGAVAEAAADGMAPGVVIAQSPSPGERLPRGATVEISRATGTPGEGGGAGA